MIMVEDTWPSHPSAIILLDIYLDTELELTAHTSPNLEEKDVHNFVAYLDT